MTQPDHAAPLWALTVAQASRRIALGTLSPVDLVEAFLARIAAVDGRLKSYILVDAAGARAAARAAADELAAGRRRGPLHGLPFAVKDNYDVAGLPTTANSRLRRDAVADRDATLVARLRRAGAVCLGKLSTWEYGTGNGGEYGDSPFPTTRNPWDLERFAGGSSTGVGAAVAAGTAMFGLGSDTTGSVRLPAAACGVVGLKPTPGRVSRHGLLPNCASLDVPGPFTWTAEDAAIVLGAIAGPDPADPVTEDVAVPDYRRRIGRGIAGLRIAVAAEGGEGFPPPDPDMAAALAAGLAILEGLGATLVETALPIPAAACFAVSRLIGPPESASIHEAELRDHPAELGFALRDKLLGGTLVRAADYIAAQRRRREIADSVEGVLAGVDALVTFGTHHVAPRLADGAAMTAFTVESTMTPFNLSGHPSLVQCTGFTPAGLPTSWQIVGHRFDEATILRVAAAYENATPWRARRAEVR
ncbi:Putative amidase AmiD [Methylobacterium crusticola]|uniref:Amidase AmiD n=1 Tax=Methylobacterium crusticola TaxID=1697972 RepID=A0ABQ4R6H8_9HYPH|nr:amidase [Methylobacterium crusticola]GJD53253.1 Putative amidase AmiD [Methylobacterium crusticola]